MFVRRLKSRWVVLGLLLVLVVVAAVVVRSRHQPDWEFVQRVMDYRFPDGTDFIAQYDNAEWYVISVVRLPVGAVSQFATSRGLAQGVEHRIDTALSLPEPYRTIPKRPDILSAQGQTGYQAWTAVLDPESRYLWVHVTYPDHGGDHPGTAPQPIVPGQSK